MKECVVIQVNVLQHLEEIKNIEIKNFLILLDRYDQLNPDDKHLLRNTFLDSINSYHRYVKKYFNRILNPKMRNESETSIFVGE